MASISGETMTLPGPLEPDVSRSAQAIPRSLRLNTLVTASSSVARGVLGFAASLVVTRALSTDARGIYSFTTNATSLLVMLAGVGVPSAMTTMKAQGKADTGELYRASYLVGVAAGAATSLAFLAAYMLQPGALFRGVTPTVAIIVAFLIPIMLVLTYWSVVAYLDDRLIEFGLATVGASAIMLLAVLGLALGRALNGFSVVLVWGLTTVLPVLIIARPSQLLGAWRSRATARQLFRFGLRVNLATIALILTWRLDVFFVKGFRGARELAFYVVAVGVAEIILQVAVSFRVALTPLQGRASDRAKLVETIIALTRLTVLVGSIGALLLAVFSHFIVISLFGTRYAPSAAALVWLVPGVVALVAQGPLIDYLLAEDHLAGVTKITGIALIVNVVLNVGLLQQFDFVVAAAASSVAYFISFAACVFLFARHTHTPSRKLLIPIMDDLRNLARRR